MKDKIVLDKNETFKSKLIYSIAFGLLIPLFGYLCIKYINCYNIEFKLGKFIILFIILSCSIYLFLNIFISECKKKEKKL